MKKSSWSLLILLFVVLRLATLSIPPLTDPSEARYAVLAKDMAENGRWFSQRVWIDGKQVPFMGKPPLGFWMMAGSMKIFGANEFAARLPSAICSILLLALMFLVLRRYADSDVAWLAVLTTASCASFFILSGAVLVDAALSLFSMGAVLFYYAFLKESDARARKVWSVLVFVFLALAFMTKGPVGLVYFGIPVFFWTLLSGKWETLKHHVWLTGGALFLLLVVPCFFELERGMPGFFDYFFVHENFLRFVTKNYGDLYSSTLHHLPFGLSIPLTLAACLPWVIFPLIQLYSHVALVVRERRGERNPAVTDEGSDDSASKWGLGACWSVLKRYSGEPEAMFPLGLIFLALFWSCSSHLMFYYLIVMTPLFGVFFGFHFKNALSVRKAVLISGALVAVYVISYLPAAYILDRDKSTRGILREVAKLDGVGEETPVVFVRREHYSAYFYGGKKIVPHLKEKVAESVRRGMKLKNVVFVMPAKYFKRIPDELREKLTVRAKMGKWLAATKRASVVGETVRR